eukprot:11116023-Prorocentrum_lima.AAC.1
MLEYLPLRARAEAWGKRSEAWSLASRTSSTSPSAGRVAPAVRARSSSCRTSSCISLVHVATSALA